ncbi:MAG TPA: hypothetical protein VJ970_02190 [Flavobacteriaceae bacterium]|nr:hypothetical protein [Flavobacteriaceae bacterium]
MEPEGMKHETNKIDEYQKKGYTASYTFNDGYLTDLETKKKYGLDEITIKEEYRYEGYTNPDDLSMLLVIEMNDGTKGTMLVPYGPNADAELAQFIKALSKK